MRKKTLVSDAYKTDISDKIPVSSSVNIMRFIQRLSCVLLILYLFLGFLLAFYVFDISLVFSDAASDHAFVHVAQVRNDRTASLSSSSPSNSFLSFVVSHATDVPFAVWLFLFLIFYLQGFCLLLAFTKPNPKQFLSTPIFFLRREKLDGIGVLSM